MLHIVHVMPSFDTGGAQLVTVRLLNGLGPGRFRHSMVSLNGGHGSASLLDPALRVDLVDGRPFARRPRLPRLVAGLRRMRPDLLFTCNWGSMDWVLARLLLPGCPHIHAEHGFGPEEADRQLVRRVWARRLALAASCRVVVPSHTLERLALEEWKLPAARLLRIPNGVDGAALRGAAAGVEQPGDGLVRIAALAPLRREKRLDRLLRAFAGMKERGHCRLHLIGDGPERAALERERDRLGLGDQVRFLGHSPTPARELAACDVFALSSDTEQLPAALLEAMALGLPVAAVAVGDVAEVVAPANARLLVPREDEAGLAGALDRLVGDAGLRRALGAANRARQEERFGLAAMVGDYRAAFEACAARRHRTPAAFLSAGTHADGV
ncbi:glycosyltransferase [Geminicoccaceae bacterium 1502E]|nr:glycosyltransferase [Geminicoccaceae bacterium 1502E]